MFPCHLKLPPAAGMKGELLLLRWQAAARNAEQQFTSMEEEASRLVRENTLLAARWGPSLYCVSVVCNLPLPCLPASSCAMLAMPDNSATTNQSGLRLAQ